MHTCMQINDSQFATLCLSIICRDAVDSGETEIKGKRKQKRQRSLSFSSGSRSSMQSDIKRHSLRVSHCIIINGQVCVTLGKLQSSNFVSFFLLTTIFLTINNNYYFNIGILVRRLGECHWLSFLSC